MKTIGDRIKKLRQLEKLSQRAFGEKIFLSQDQISLLEKNKRVVTDRVIHSICSIYKVNEEWLRNEVGEIYTDCLKDLEINEEIKRVTNLLYELDKEDIDAITNMIEFLQNKKRK